MGQEAQRLSFIVRVWLEETAEETGEAAWRGSVTSVPDGTQRYIQGLDEIPRFIAPYLEAMGVKLEKRRGSGRADC
jgi:hypothetical protein